MNKFFTGLLSIFFLFSPSLFSQEQEEEKDVFAEHLYKKEIENRKRLEKERKLNRELFDALRKGLLNDDVHVRLSSIRSIMAMMEITGKEQLIKDYLDDISPLIRLAILDYYQKKLNPERVPTLMEIVEDKDLEVRLKLVDVVASYQEDRQEVYGLMQVLLEDRQLSVKEKMLQRISKIPVHLIDQKKMFSTLSDVLYDGALSVRLKALSIIRPYSLEYTHDLLEAMLQEPQIRIRQMALSVVGGKEDERATKLIIDSLSDSYAPIRRQAIRLLAGRLNEKIIRVFENHLLGERDIDIKIEVLRSTGKYRSPLAVSVLSAYLDDPVARVRQVASDELRKIQESINLDRYNNSR
jgi:HEAT repeat protein